MKRLVTYILAVILPLLAGVQNAAAQGTVPAGINYQAVARDNSGNELVNTDIEVRFTIRSGSALGTPVYQEVFTDVTTSRYGVFSLIIGTGDPVLGTFEEIDWSTANHHLTVDIKFENNFLEMGTLQFLSVPYALYAAKSLLPGPPGPQGLQGPPGDPATDTDDQELIYDRDTKVLQIESGNSVRLDTIIAFRARNLISDIAPQISNVTMTYDEPDLSIGGGFDAGTGVFTAPADGIYTFNVSYFADGTQGSGRELAIYVNSAPYEKLAIDISAGTTVPVRSVTIRLSQGNTVSVNVYTGTATQTGTGSFAGYKVG